MFSMQTARLEFVLTSNDTSMSAAFDRARTCDMATRTSSIITRQANHPDHGPYRIHVDGTLHRCRTVLVSVDDCHSVFLVYIAAEGTRVTHVTHRDARIMGVGCVINQQGSWQPLPQIMVDTDEFRKFQGWPLRSPLPVSLAVLSEMYKLDMFPVRSQD